MFDAVRMSPLDVLSALSHPALLPRRLASEDRTKGFCLPLVGLSSRESPAGNGGGEEREGQVLISLLPP